MTFYQNKNFRRVLIPLLRFFNPGRITIKHHYTGGKFSLDAFHHKGYWFYGKKRERATMELFAKLIKPDYIILEVGGHIGYITNYFSDLLTKGGIIYVFEPGINNLPFLRKNIEQLDNVILIQKAVSDRNGKAKFYIEDLTGQNNSLLPDYANFKENSEMSFVKSEKKEVEVETITIDTFCKEYSIIPDFIKIDIEGAELLALKGMSAVLSYYSPLMMIEITENWQHIYETLYEAGYKMYNENRIEIGMNNNHSGNTFCFHKIKHKLELDKVIQGIA